MATEVLDFASFRLDLQGARLLRDGAEVALRPKAFVALCTLAEHAGELVTKEDLVRAVWPEVAVSDVSVKVCIREIRKALGDDARRPRFIETVHRRGYRFIADVSATVRQADRASAPVVGREQELRLLAEQAAASLGGERQVTLISGPAGIGKSTLVEAFVAALDSAATWQVVGRCAEQYGAGEPFLPLLEGLTRLGHGPNGERLVRVLRSYAPTWLAQLPGLISEAEHERLRSRFVGAAWPRMHRELVVGLEALGTEVPIVLVVEDLQWADHSSLALLRALGVAREAARIHLVCTFRSGDSASSAGPLGTLRRELGSRPHARELELGPLAVDPIAEYLSARLGSAELGAQLAPELERLTAGHPLFLVTVVDDLLRRDVVAASGNDSEELIARVRADAPRSLQQLLRRQLESLSAAELRVLQAASVVGEEFHATEIAAALEEESERVELLCRRLAKRGDLVRFAPADVAAGRGARFRLGHPLFTEVLRETLTADQHARLHGGLVRRLETLGEEAERLVVPVRLATHAEAASDLPRAIRFLLEAGRSACDRFADREAIGHLGRGLELLEGLPPSAERDRLELELQVALAVPLLNTLGFAHEQVERVHHRALELSERVGDTSHSFRALEGLHTYYSLRGDLGAALRLAERLMAIAQQERDPLFLVEGHHTIGCTEVRRGRLEASRLHLEEALALYDRSGASAAIGLSGHDPYVCCASHLGLSLWAEGLPDRGLEHAGRALEYALEIEHPGSEGIAREILCWLHILRGESEAALEQADATVRLGQEHAFPYHAAIGFMLQGRARAALGDAAAGVALVEQGQAMREALGIGAGGVDYLLLLAECHLEAERYDEALAALARCRTLVERSGERLFEPELHRLRGAVLARQARAAGTAPSGEAVEEIRRGLELAKDAGTRALALRAATTLAELGAAEHGREPKDELVELLESFSEGQDTADLQAARVIAGA